MSLWYGRIVVSRKDWQLHSMRSSWGPSSFYFLLLGPLRVVLHAAAAAPAKSLQSCLTLCDPIDGSPPRSSILGILQAITLEWVAISFSNAWKWKVKSEVAQLCPTLSDPMNCSLPGSSVHGIFQARVLELVYEMSKAITVMLFSLDIMKHPLY